MPPGASCTRAGKTDTPDGRHALVTRDGDNGINRLTIDGTSVVPDARTLTAGVRPYAIDIRRRLLGLLVNAGGGQGDSSTMSLIDLKAQPPRVVDSVDVGQTPEVAVFAPDGVTVGVNVMDGSNKPRNSPFYGVAKFLQFRIFEGRLQKRSELRGGAWLQGAAYSSDGRVVIVQDGVNRQLRLYRTDNENLVDTGERLAMDGAPSVVVRWR